MKCTIFDIDGVLADSRHRQNFCTKTGKLNLSNWRKNSTAKKIGKDKPIKKYIDILKDCSIAVIMTARVISKHDKNWLEKNVKKGLKIYSRPENITFSDHFLKTCLFEKLQRDMPHVKKWEFFDDNIKNCEALEALGVKSIYVKDGLK